MSRTIINAPDVAKAPPHYSHAVKAAGLVFVSGTPAYHPETGKIVGETIQEQVAQSLRNITAILKAAGTTLDKAVSATILLTDEADFPGANEEWVKWFPVDPPARQAAKLPVRIPGLRVSIALIAEA